VTPVTAPLADWTSSPALQAAAGRYHTCAVTSDGNVFCWGANNRGQLGNFALPSGSGARVASAQPVVHADGSWLADVRAVSAGGYHTCALTHAGNVYCWGANDLGQLGNDGTTSSAVPTLVGEYQDPIIGRAALAAGFPPPRTFVPLAGVETISAGLQHSCAVTS